MDLARILKISHSWASGSIGPATKWSSRSSRLTAPSPENQSSRRRGKSGDTAGKILCCFLAAQVYSAQCRQATQAHCAWLRPLRCHPIAWVQQIVWLNSSNHSGEPRYGEQRRRPSTATTVGTKLYQPGIPHRKGPGDTQSAPTAYLVPAPTSTFLPFGGPPKCCLCGPPPHDSRHASPDARE